MLNPKILHRVNLKTAPYSWLRFACSGSFCAVWGNSCRTCQGNHLIIMKWVFNPSTFSVCSFSIPRVEFLQLGFVRLRSASCIQASLHGSTLMSECLVGKTLWSLFLSAVSVWTYGDINEKMHSNEPCNYKTSDASFIRCKTAGHVIDMDLIIPVPKLDRQNFPTAFAVSCLESAMNHWGW